jgi:hypothetical protein
MPTSGEAIKKGSTTTAPNNIPLTTEEFGFLFHRAHKFP